MKNNKKEEKQKKTTKSKLIQQSFQYTKREWKLIVLVNITSLFPLYLHAKNPIIETAFLEAASNKNQNIFTEQLMNYLYINLLLILINPINTYLTFLLDQRLAMAMKQDLFSHVINQDFEFFEKYNSGELVTLFNKSLNQVKRQATGQGILNPFKQIVNASTNAYILFTMSQQITAFMLILIPMYAILDFVFSRLYKKLELQEERKKNKRSNVTNEVIQNIMTVKSFGKEKEEINKFLQFQEENFQKSKVKSFVVSIETTLHKLLELSRPIILFSCSISMLFSQDVNLLDGEFQQKDQGLILQEQQQQQQQQFFQSSKKQKKNFSAGKISTFLRYSSSLLSLYNGIKSLIKQLGMKREEPHMERIYEILQHQSKLKDEGQEVLEEGEGRIEFRNVTFYYANINKDEEETENASEKRKEKVKEQELKVDDKQVQILNNVSFEIPNGHYVAFVGMSGAGKSTIIKLIQRFYDVNEGAILVGNHYIKDVTQQSLRSKIGFVSQNLQLFNKSIEENITYGVEKGSYTQEELIKCCEMAGCYEFITNPQLFPQGFQTNVGEKGVKLSGGQLQRLAIARALMKKPSILIFDEATSALDAEKEYQVQQSIEELAANNQQQKITIIVVAHRLSTVVNCQKIFVMKQGIIAEEGTHSQLLALKGVYSELMHRQLAADSTQSSDIQSPQMKTKYNKGFKKNNNSNKGQSSEDEQNNEEDTPYISY